MNRITKNFLFWTPRLITILFALFLSVFAADVFDGNYSFIETILALFMHLIPVFLVLIILVLSWKWEWIGGILYLALALLYSIASSQKMNFSVFLLIPLPLVIIGALFLLGWFKRKEIRKQSDSYKTE